jgi:hypothetical protein
MRIFMKIGETGFGDLPVEKFPYGDSWEWCKKTFTVQNNTYRRHRCRRRGCKNTFFKRVDDRQLCFKHYLEYQSDQDRRISRDEEIIII